MKDNLVIDKNGLTEEEFLQRYDAGKYERPSVTVDMLIFTVVDEVEENYRKLPEKALKVLLVKRGQHPYINQWALPGGFVNVNESVDNAAYRELKSETNVDEIYMEQLYTWGEVNRDPRTRVISCSYMALVDSSSLQLKAGDDAADARWFKLDYKLIEEKREATEKGYVCESTVKIRLWDESEEMSGRIKIVETVEGKITRITREILESDGIAFDHMKIIQYGIERLRNKIEYTNIAFNLMADYFTLTELQKVYEIILDKELLAAAFRRKVADMVIETEEFTKDAGHRPSKLYKYNTLWREK